MVQVVLVVSLLVLAVAGAVWALYGQINTLFGKADTTLAAPPDQLTSDDKSKGNVPGIPRGNASNSIGTGNIGSAQQTSSAVSDSVNAIGNSIQQSAQQNAAAAAKANGTP